MSTRIIKANVNLEVSGRPLKVQQSKAGIEVVERGDSVQIRILGSVRDILLAPKDIANFAQGGITDGRLGIISNKDGIKVMVSGASSTELSNLVQKIQARKAETQKILSGSKPGDSRKRAALKILDTIPTPMPRHGQPKHQSHLQPAEGPDQKRPRINSRDSGTGSQTDTSNSLYRFDDQMFELLASFACTTREEIVKYLSGFFMSCKVCDSFLVAYKSTAEKTLRLRCAYPKNHPKHFPAPMDTNAVARCIARRPKLQVLDLSGYAELDGHALLNLASLQDCAEVFAHLRVLLLRGCKLITDTSVRRFLAHVGHGRSGGLEALSILDCPKLSDSALLDSDGHLTVSLHVLSAGSSHPSGQKSTGKASRFAAKFTVRLVEQLAALRGPNGPLLTHLTLLGCIDIQTLPNLPASLQHLDIRGADVGDLHMLKACVNLHSLVLADNPNANVAPCLASLPSPTKLKALDLSECLGVNKDIWKSVANFQNLTHLRLASCPLEDDRCAWILSKLRRLQVLDVSRCPGIEDGYRLDTLTLRGTTNPVQLEALRILAVGGTALERNLELTRRELRMVAPNAVVCGGASICDHTTLPPTLT